MWNRRFRLFNEPAKNNSIVSMSPVEGSGTLSPLAFRSLGADLNRRCRLFGFQQPQIILFMRVSLTKDFRCQRRS
jgi:hypothetical protein